MQERRTWDARKNKSSGKRDGSIELLLTLTLMLSILCTFTALSESNTQLIMSKKYLPFFITFYLLITFLGGVTVLNGKSFPSIYNGVLRTIQNILGLYLSVNNFRPSDLCCKSMLTPHHSKTVSSV